jgi:hypothetical protein
VHKNHKLMKSYKIRIKLFIRIHYNLILYLINFQLSSHFNLVKIHIIKLHLNKNYNNFNVMYRIKN